MADSNISNSDLKIKQNLIKLFNDEVRLTIILFLSRYPRLSFKQIVGIVEKSKSTVSHHLKKLLQAGVIAEIDVGAEEKTHGKEKFYSLVINPDLDMKDFAFLPKLEQDKIMLILFEYGRFYFIFMNRLLKQIIDYSENTVELVLDLEKKDLIGLKEWNSKISEIQNIIQLTKFYATPLPKDKYIELMDYLVNYTNEFMEKHNQSSEYNPEEELYWIMAVGLPFSKIKNLNSK